MLAGCTFRLIRTWRHPFTLFFSTLLSFYALPCCGVQPSAQAEAAPGLTVEALDDDSWGAAAGLQLGDRITGATLEAEARLGLERREAAFELPFELEALFIEETPRRAVVLQGSRGGDPQSWTLPRGASLSAAGLRVRPSLPPTLLALYTEAREHAAGGHLAKAAEAWREAARGSLEKPHVAAWFLSTLARAYADAGSWPEADAAFRAATDLLAFPSADLSQRLQDWGTRLLELNRWAEAAERFERALAVDRALAPRTLSSAWSLTGLGNAKSASDSKAAIDLFRQAHALRTELAPESSDVAASLIDLGVEAGRDGDLDEADRLFRGALEIEERLRPDTLAVARLVNNLGVVSGMRGDLEAEEGFYRRALQLKERLKASGAQLASTLNNLGVTAKARGHLAAAEEYYGRALALHRAESAESLWVAGDLNNLGLLALRRFDTEAAEDHFRSSIAILEKLAPGSPELAEKVANLGLVAHSRGDLPRARDLAVQAYDLFAGLPLEDSRRALAILELASVERDLGHLDRAEALAREVTERGGGTPPQTLVTMQAWSELGGIAGLRGQRESAEAHYARALAIQEKLAPENRDHAQLRNELGRLQVRFGARAAGLTNLCRAVEVVERGRSKIGGTDSQRLLTEAQLGHFYHDCASALVEAGRADEAFSLLERGRARIFLQQLEERDLVFSRDLAPEVDSRRRRLDRRYEAKETEISRFDLARDTAAAGRALGELRALGREREELQRQIRQVASPLTTLQSESSAETSPQLAAPDPGTVLLSYSVGDESTLLFTLSAAGAARPALAAFRLPLGSRALAEKVARFRTLVEDSGSAPEPIQALGAELYRLLLGPADRSVRRAERIVIVGDGPLLSLPFAAIFRTGRGGRGVKGGQYLAEWKPLHTVLSAAVYARLRGSRPAAPVAASGTLTAFGDPVYPGGAGAEGPGMRFAVRSGLALTPLPGSRRELEAIAALFPQARIFTGAAATEENVRAVDRSTRRLHLAVHGLLNERSPLDSALAFSLPEGAGEARENGLLHAWEILESVRLDADLVTLSACSSGLGQAMGGEGLIGLTRAFQYAGARSVLASLWSVSDASTAALMQRFYAHLARGVSKDRALALAQRELLRLESGRWSHPYYWAAFQLAGDWR
jgi:CHAT domain-containing protein/Tfp pilus assembly protein PilF